MPTPVSHAAVGYAIASWARADTETRRLGIVAAACAALPDIDWPWNVATTSLFSHRAITHSLLFAALSAVLATCLCFTRSQRSTNGRTILLILGLAALSHACLDALSSYSYGIEFFAPFWRQRFRFVWTPLGDPSGTLAGQLRQELFVVFLPAVVLATVGLWVRRTRRGRFEPDHPGSSRHTGLGL